MKIANAMTRKSYCRWHSQDVRQPSGFHKVVAVNSTCEQAGSTQKIVNEMRLDRLQRLQAGPQGLPIVSPCSYSQRQAH